MRDEEPPVVAGRPAQPGVRQAPQVRPGGQAALDGLAGVIVLTIIPVVIAARIAGASAITRSAGNVRRT